MAHQAEQVHQGAMGTGPAQCLAVQRLPAQEFAVQAPNTPADGVLGIYRLTIGRDPAFQLRQADLPYRPVERRDAGQAAQGQP